VHRGTRPVTLVGVPIALIRDGKLAWRRGFGVKDTGTNQPVDNETVFAACSDTKPVFAYAVLKLCEKGVMDLETPLTKYTSKRLLADPRLDLITVRHVLNHTTGFPNWRNGPELKIEFTPGEKYQYCNLAYFMLAEIIKQVSGMPWQNYIHDKLFVPVGMNDSHMTDFYMIIPNRASGYMHRHDTLVNAPAMLAIRPSGGFLSTTSDMIKWEKTIAEKKIILKKENWEKLWQPFIKMSDEPDSKAYYGFGWAMDEYKGHKIVIHGGANPGFRSVYIRFVTDNLSIIILTNTDEADPHAVGFALADYFLRK
jgi:CubicO group peptidase (beta-lactamase class C family)